MMHKPSLGDGWLTLYRSDIAVLKTYGAAPYATALKKLEKDIKDKQSSVNEKIGVKVITYLAL
jgi:uncharacterized protein YgiM (DUF1202 family)